MGEGKKWNVLDLTANDLTQKALLKEAWKVNRADTSFSNRSDTSTTFTITVPKFTISQSEKNWKEVLPIKHKPRNLRFSWRFPVIKSETLPHQN